MSSPIDNIWSALDFLEDRCDCPESLEYGRVVEHTDKCLWVAACVALERVTRMIRYAIPLVERTSDEYGFPVGFVNDMPREVVAKRLCALIGKEKVKEKTRRSPQNG